MRTLYFDCFAGISGDMIVGALIDLGVDFEELKRQLSSLKMTGWSISVSRVKRCGIAAVKFDVEFDESLQVARSLSDVRDLIERSAISDSSKVRSLKVFERLATAEARVHGTTEEDVHFHEVGAVDSIADIVATIVGIELLGVERLLASPLRVGFGSINAAHGLLPVPAPGTAELLKGVPIYSGDLEGEFVTPTGAAIVTTLCEGFGPMPRWRIEELGYGAGSRDPSQLPNVLRLVLGTSTEEGVAELGGWTDRELALSAGADRVAVIETNIDDMNPQAYGYLMERAFAIGALDVFITPVQMKKTRPGVLLTVVCAPDKLELLGDLLMSETTTLGVRYHDVRRRVLERSIETVETPYGPIKIKVARQGGRTLHFQPEYEDCLRLARETGVALLEVQGSASAVFRQLLKDKEIADGKR